MPTTKKGKKNPIFMPTKGTWINRLIEARVWRGQTGTEEDKAQSQELKIPINKHPLSKKTRPPPVEDAPRARGARGVYSGEVGKTLKKKKNPPDQHPPQHFFSTCKPDTLGSQEEKKPKT